MTSDAEAAFLAGAALNSLDNLVRSDPPWAGAWRQRLALRCAAAAVALAGRTEDEAALRDAWHLRRPGDAPGPAGNILAAWRRLASRSPGADEATLRSIVDLLGYRWSDELVLSERLDSLARSTEPAPLTAARIVAEVRAARPDAGLLGWWLADQVLALRMRWPLPVPLLVAQASSHAVRAVGRPARPEQADRGGEGRALCVALALAAAEACRLASEIAGRAACLQAVASRLRAKGAGEGIRLLLDDDAVPGTLQTKSLSRWGSRRLFERLSALGAVRELSGRPAFRLYGL